MTKTIHYIALALSCRRDAPDGSSADLPSMPMQAVFENSLEYAWYQKQVYDSKLIADMETMDASLLLESPTKGMEPPREGRPWGVSSAFYKVDGEDWTDWNRISCWIYPDLPGFKVVSVSLVFHNEGEDKTPDAYDRDGLNYQVLQNHAWNRAYWEIAHLGREKVTGIEIRYRLQGHEPGAAETACYFIDEVCLEKVDADHFEGWNVATRRQVTVSCGQLPALRRHLTFSCGQLRALRRQLTFSCGQLPALRRHLTFSCGQLPALRRQVTFSCGQLPALRRHLILPADKLPDKNNDC
jgi:hypothetical protein